jgi:ArsR family transcriptional regulator
MYNLFMADQDLIKIFKALSDETRLDIVRKIAEQSCASSCGSVSSCSSLSQPAMSHHFKKLVDAGILLEKKSGIEKFYELNHQLLDYIGINVNKIKELK